MRQVILVVYASLMALMLLFPPTVISSRSIDITEGFRLSFPTGPESGGFRFIGSIGVIKENGGDSSRTVAMEFKQLGIQILMVTLIAGAAYLAADRKRSDD